MKYSICEIEKEENGHKFNMLDYDLTEVEYKEYFSNMKVLDYFKKMKFYKKMIEYDGTVLSQHINNHELINGESITSRVELANKYAYDLAGAFVSFIEYIEKRVISKESMDVQREFKEFKNDMFNKKIEYRFWYYMRNYTTHYDLPFSNGTGKIKEDKYYVDIICEKNHLLEYSEWKHVKKDIEAMNNDVDINSLIEPLLVFVNALYLQMVFIFRKEILEANKYTAEFIKKYKIKKPIVFMKYKSIEELKTMTNTSFTPLRISEVVDLVKDLSRNKNVNLTYKKIEYE